MPNETTFYGLGIAPNILAILDRLSFKTPTPIQEKSIPSAIEGKDLIGLAQTGTGKTLAFGVPMLQAALAGKRGLVILPTRELALQVEETFRKIGAPLGLRTALLIGGAPMGRQVQDLRRNPMIVIGTPGRIIDHLEQKTVSLTQTAVLVLDEADRMLDMGFAPQLRRILVTVPRERQTMLFSATMPETIVHLANSYMKLPLRIEIAPPGTTIEKITQELFFIPKADKPRLLEKVLYEYRGSVLVFTRTKFGAKRIAAGVRALGHTAAELHSNRSLNQRREALDGFRNGKYRVLVATDIAARGIDVKGIELVVNYDLPTNAEDYVHRIGRTGRAGAVGRAISFAMPEEKNDVRDIERLMRAALPSSALPELPPARYMPREMQGPVGTGPHGPSASRGYPPRRYPPRPSESGFQNSRSRFRRSGPRR
ncbi:MAG TPA: DEAD/DEAH box helicase [Candidatus Paceibacterota bacterium]|jgi:ATP-dependent RNA helicase RhlE|nr:DEAD/DEAH box helicase [Candidatus Paceibacterota bacterium]